MILVDFGSKAKISANEVHLVHHDPDDLINPFWTMERKMTVFGFGVMVSKNTCHKRPLRAESSKPDRLPSQRDP